MANSLVEHVEAAGIDVHDASDESRYIDVPQLTDDVREAIENAGFIVEGKALRMGEKGRFHRVFVREDPSREVEEVVLCPRCGYRNDPGEWRCKGTVMVRGDKRECGKDLADERPTASVQDFAVNKPGGRP